jgi:hypothetical protein
MGGDKDAFLFPVFLIKYMYNPFYLCLCGTEVAAMGGWHGCDVHIFVNVNEILLAKRKSTVFDLLDDF